MINLEYLDNEIIELNKFQLGWRFEPDEINEALKSNLSLIKPLSNQASLKLSEFLKESKLHDQFPFENDLFEEVEILGINDLEKSRFQEWLYKRQPQLDKLVYLSWDDDTAAMTSWELFVKNYDYFHYSGSDDLTIFDLSLDWSILFHHASYVYFGTSRKHN